jgi:hypothetical protein
MVLTPRAQLAAESLFLRKQLAHSYVRLLLLVGTALSSGAERRTKTITLRQPSTESNQAQVLVQRQEPAVLDDVRW